MPPKKKETPVGTTTSKRLKTVLKRSPKDMAADVVKSLNNKRIREVMVFGCDDFTIEFIKAYMRLSNGFLFFSDFNSDKASFMNRTISKYTNSGIRSSYVNRNEALQDDWSDLLILGSKESAKAIQAGLAFQLSDVYGEIIVLEDF